MSPHSRGSMDISDRIAYLVNTTAAALIDLNKRADVPKSPLDKLSEQQARTLRYAAIAASVVSIFSGLVGFYVLGAIDARRRVFRHHLIFFLIAFDFLKAVTLLFYPARVALVSTAYQNNNFCDIVGFFTATAIEGADLAILTFAIHTAILVFAPSRKYKNGDKFEGGLFPYRIYIWIGSILFPLVLAALAFVDKVGYQPLVSWCYLPERPKWYRLVLSWVPRYIIVVTILALYLAIYIHVLNEFRQILYIHEDLNNKKSHRLKFDRNLFVNLKYLATKFFTGGRIGERRRSSSNTSDDSVELEDLERKRAYTDFGTRVHRGLSQNGRHKRKNQTSGGATHDGTVDEQRMVQKSLHEETMDSFEERRIVIEKQMKSIFVYPISYIFLWLAPFALQCIQYDYELRHGPVYWLTAIAAFMQPFNCTVDTIVFLYREKPWNFTVKAVSRKIESGSVHLYANDRFDNYYDTHETWRKKLSWLPLYGVPESIKEDRERLRKQETVVYNEPSAFAKNIIENKTHDFSDILKAPLDESEFRRMN